MEDARVTLKREKVLKRLQSAGIMTLHECRQRDSFVEDSKVGNNKPGETKAGAVTRSTINKRARL